MRPLITAKSHWVLAIGLMLAGLACNGDAVAAPAHAALLLAAGDTAPGGGRFDEPGPGDPDSPGGSPGSAQQQPDFDGPSEDGTEAAPDGSSGRDSGGGFERPPGCQFHGGPLELFV
ncbi:MAG: hypothetical protein HOP09_14905 [Hyphomicrobium sp.]|nr:hypothetical protein [Hyphomicrobium sp.]